MWYLLAVWERELAQEPWWLPLQLSFQSHNTPSLSSHNSSPVWATLPQLEPRVSGCERDFVCWPFKRVPGFPLDSSISLVDRIPGDFHSQMLHSLLFLALVFLTWEPGIGWEGTFAAEISLWIFNHHTCLWGQPFLFLHSSYQSWCSFFYKSLVMRLIVS